MHDALVVVCNLCVFVSVCSGSLGGSVVHAHRFWIEKANVSPFEVNFDERRARTTGADFELSLAVVLESEATSKFPKFVAGTLPKQYENELAMSTRKMRKSMGTGAWLHHFLNNRACHARAHVYKQKHQSSDEEDDADADNNPLADRKSAPGEVGPTPVSEDKKGQSPRPRKAPLKPKVDKLLTVDHVLVIDDQIIPEGEELNRKKSKRQYGRSQSESKKNTSAGHQKQVATDGTSSNGYLTRSAKISRDRTTDEGCKQLLNEFESKNEERSVPSLASNNNQPEGDDGGMDKEKDKASAVNDNPCLHDEPSSLADVVESMLVSDDDSVGGGIEPFAGDCEVDSLLFPNTSAESTLADAQITEPNSTPTQNESPLKSTVSRPADQELWKKSMSNNSQEVATSNTTSQAPTALPKEVIREGITSGGKNQGEDHCQTFKRVRKPRTAKVAARKSVLSKSLDRVVELNLRERDLVGEGYVSTSFQTTKTGAIKREVKDELSHCEPSKSKPISNPVIYEISSDSDDFNCNDNTEATNKPSQYEAPSDSHGTGSSPPLHAGTMTNDKRKEMDQPIAQTKSVNGLHSWLGEDPDDDIFDGLILESKKVGAVPNTSSNGGDAGPLHADPHSDSLTIALNELEKAKHRRRSEKVSGVDQGIEIACSALLESESPQNRKKKTKMRRRSQLERSVKQGVVSKESSPPISSRVLPTTKELSSSSGGECEVHRSIQSSESITDGKQKAAARKSGTVSQTKMASPAHNASTIQQSTSDPKIAISSPIPERPQIKPQASVVFVCAPKKFADHSGSSINSKAYPSRFERQLEKDCVYWNSAKNFSIGSWLQEEINPR